MGIKHANTMSGVDNPAFQTSKDEWNADHIGVGSPDWYNVKDYSVIGDGVTDDNAAIHAIRDTASTNGTLYFPASTYLVSGLTANIAGQSWILAPGAIIKLKTNGNAHTITVTSAATKFLLRGGKIDANKANQSGSNLNGIDSAAPDAWFDGVWVLNAKSFGISLNDGGPRQKVTHCNIETAGAAGVNLDGNAASVKQHNCLIAYNYINAPVAQGVFVKGNNTIGNAVYGTRIIGNYIYNAATQGIETNSYADESIIAYNRIEGAATDLGISVVSDRNVCMGNVINGTDAAAIEISFSGSTVIGNVVYNHTGRGIVINIDTGNRVDDNVIEGNTIMGPLSVTPFDALANTEGMGIFGTAGTAARNVFKGNTIYNGTHIAIKFGRCSETVVDGNTIVETVTRFAAVECDTTSDGGQHSITNNKIIYTAAATNSSSDLAIQLNNSANCDCSGNKIYGNGVLPQGIVAGASITDLTLEGNRIIGCTTDCINVTNNSATIIAHGNKCKKSSGSTPIVLGAAVKKRDNYDWNGAAWLTDV